MASNTEYDESQPGASTLEFLIEDALRANVETARCLDMALGRLRSGDVSHLSWIREAYFQARAASTSARFAVIAAEDNRRLQRERP
ncbi:hypothetical protein JOD54_005713 [Actinokineospora baliensis]|uniref:hypothetical protein n=1 Tax=Actinokineospora baliensis TaxID=547056 RepID=UPI0019566FFC|nr:hypothetical protein [Actinokineospora baliensis]MBM7775509.1 hypothetical protein [Actinokineospora baliensis]